MAISQRFNDAVAGGDLTLVRIMLKNSLIEDSTFSKFQSMESAARVLPGLYEPHDGREFRTDPAEWNADYLSLLDAQADSNFSRERIEHMKKVVRHLYPPKSSTPSSGRPE